MSEYVIENGKIYLSISSWGLFEIGDVVEFDY